MLKGVLTWLRALGMFRLRATAAGGVQTQHAVRTLRGNFGWMDVRELNRDTLWVTLADGPCDWVYKANTLSYNTVVLTVEC